MTTLRGVPALSGRSLHSIKRRPKDRKAQIARAAAEAFSTHGYHTASMEEIATKVGISAPALYRHYPSKYDMFAAAVLGLGQQLVECTDFVDVGTGPELATRSRAVLDRVIDAVIDVALRNRESGGLYRWQTRYLHPDDHIKLLAQMEVVNRRIQQPLLALRPALTSPDRWMLSVGLLSVIGSIVDHRLKLPDDEIRAVLTGAVAALLTADLPDPTNCAAGRLSVWRIFSADAGAYEGLLCAAMVLFGNQGYAETSLSQIADVVGVPSSGVYRYFSSKCDILTTGVRRAAERVSGELMAITGVFTDRRQVLARLIEALVATAFANPELSSVYYTERVNLAPVDRESLLAVERSGIDSWVQVLTSIRPDLNAMQARFLVHAATALVSDLGRMFRDRGAVGDEEFVGCLGYGQVGVQWLMGRVLVGSDEPTQAMA